MFVFTSSRFSCFNFNFDKVLLYVFNCGSRGVGFFCRVFLLSFIILIVFRFPYVYSVLIAILFIGGFSFTSYLAAATCRFLLSFDAFINSFVYNNIIWLLGVLWGLLEWISYLVRPITLVLRPVINICCGVLAVDVVFSYVAGCEIFNSIPFFLMLYNDYFYVTMLGVGLVVYEWCVCCVQWYIVKSLVVIESDS